MKTSGLILALALGFAPLASAQVNPEFADLIE